MKRMPHTYRLMTTASAIHHNFSFVVGRKVGRPMRNVCGREFWYIRPKRRVYIDMIAVNVMHRWPVRICGSADPRICGSNADWLTLNLSPTLNLTLTVNPVSEPYTYSYPYPSPTPTKTLPYSPNPRIRTFCYTSVWCTAVCLSVCTSWL